MRYQPGPSLPCPAWIDRIFEEKQAHTYGVVRRAVSNVERHRDGVGDLIREAKRRGFHVIETGEQLVILCNPGVLKIHC